MSKAIPEYLELEATILEALRDDLGQGEFELLALTVHRFQATWNLPYARWCATRPPAETWKDIPAVPQSIFKRYRLSVAPDKITTTFRTSGTTGEGYGEHHFVDVRLCAEALRRSWQMLGLPRARLFSLTPSPTDAPHSSLSHMLGAVMGRNGRFFVAADGKLDAGELVSAIESAIGADEPIGLLGTALAFLNLFGRIRSRGLVLPPGSFALETGGYKGSGRELEKSDLYDMFRAFLGLAPQDVINEYGMTELSSQFYARGLGTPHEGPPWLRAVVIDPETGLEVEDDGLGILRIFDLANLGSVLAIETQDLAIRRGDKFELMGRDPGALPRGCSRMADEAMQTT
jgi:hypothetical protein